MYKHILVAVDGSDTSNLALKEAVKLTKEQHALLLVVHVVDETPAYSMTDIPFPISAYQKVMREAGEKVLAECSSTIQTAGIKFQKKCIVIDSLLKRICEAISEEAKSWPADLIVIGTHGRHGFDRLLLGSVAEGVIRIATKPVLIIRGA
jgi:nucleotide-binding universal stress UspA family protein